MSPQVKFKTNIPLLLAILGALLVFSIQILVAQHEGQRITIKETLETNASP